MSFLRALSSDSLSSNSKSATNQTQSFASSSSSANHHNSHAHTQTNQTAPTGGGHRRHHAKALLHPMSLLLRRRSGQSNHGMNESSPGLARDLPDDFDPGIIYGTRHPDWSFPRRSAPPQTHNILRPEIRVQGNSGNGSSSQNKDPAAENAHPRKRQAFFTEHFSDFDTQNRSEHSEQDFEKVQSNSPHALGTPNIGSSREAPSTGDDAARPIPISAQDPAADSSGQGLHAVNGDLAQWRLVEAENGDGEENPSNIARYPDISLDPLHNSSRFSFEASSAAESIHGEELTLSENLIQRSQYRPYTGDRRGSYDAVSFTSDDIQSITSEDLRDEDGDGFTAAFSDFPQSIAPPPGFENVVVDAMENARLLQKIGLEERSDTQPTSPNVASIGSSEIGINGSTTEEEEGAGGFGEEEDGEDGEGRGGGAFDNTHRLAYPPFVNPPGSNHGIVTWESAGTEPSGTPLISGAQGSSILTFHNIFQTAALGVNEYDSGSPSSFSGAQSLRQPGYHTEFPGDEEAEIGDEDDMIAEANRDALASDSDGWYGQEFDFYPSSSTNSTYLAGGFFGIDLPKPGFVRNPSLTPISERSEGSLRNSLSIMSPNSMAGGGVSAGPLSTALFTELAKREQLSCDEATLSQLQLLGGTKSPEEAVRHLTLIASSPSTIAPITNILDSPKASAPSSVPPGFEESTCHHSGDISTSYVLDTDLGWVMEKRRGGELIQRELVQGAV
ncbi:hypothetical protein TWF718_007980 [Orbilia javanica]|uniref:Uncharacterized protein n=1 Tax=Orbilia javanica TaxID=47235 RepID=A0AAN8MW59_9PEZI